MRILLINPPSKFEIIGNNPTVIEESRGHNPPLGLLLLAGYLERETNHDITILDTQAEALTYTEIGNRVATATPDVIGITTMTQTLIDVLRVVEICRAHAPSARVVLGGPHVHLFPEETINLPGINFLVLGEGEITFKDLLANIDNADALKSIPGLVFFDGAEVIQTGPPNLIKDLDALPFPARHMTDVNLYDSVLSPRHPVTTMFTSRGCPYVCSFCDRPHLGKKFRARSAGNVVDEMERCVELGIKEFLIYDDTFTVRKQRVLDVCRELMRRQLDIGYDVRARIDTVDSEMLTMMAKSGCRGIHYGVEAGTEKILKVLRKGIEIPAAKKIFEQTKAAGMQVLAYFMIGNPTETIDDIRETFRVARALDPDFIHLTVLTPFPGTAIYRDGLESGVFEKDIWREFAATPHLGFVPPYWPENFTLEQLNDLLVEGYRGFYRRPQYLIKRVLNVRSPHELLTKAKAGVRVLTMRSKTERRGRFPWKG